ncbi:MAG: hypothetical protein ISS66_09095 [Desulfobacteraceae bacterium]|nr:hypothetical protein [Desulfobacteraceae bacterium]
MVNILAYRRSRDSGKDQAFQDKINFFNAFASIEEGRSPYRLADLKAGTVCDEPLGLEPLGLEPLGLEPLGLELGAERLGAERLGAERLGAERLPSTCSGPELVEGSRVVTRPTVLIQPIVGPLRSFLTNFKEIICYSWLVYRSHLGQYCSCLRLPELFGNC